MITNQTKNKKLKIGINLLVLYEITGIGIYVKNLLENLGKIDNEDLFFIFCNSEILSEIYFGYRNFKYIKIPINPNSKLMRIFAEQFLLPFYLIKYKCDILFTPSVFVPVFSFSKKVTTLHDIGWLNDKRTNLKNLYLKLVTKASINSKRIITVSIFAKKEILSFYPKIENKIKVIYNGVPNLPQIDPFYRLHYLDKVNFKKYFFYIGLIVPHKNIENMLKAFKIFSEKYKNIGFILSGREVSELINTKEIINSLELEGKVFLTGRISDEEKVFLYKNSVALIFPSLHEGFGLPVLEAQSLGIPVLTSNVSALPEVAGEGALYVNPYDVEDIAKGMEKIAFDENLRKELIRKGFENIKRFSWEESAKKLLGVFKEVYENPSGE